MKGNLPLGIGLALLAGLTRSQKRGGSNLVGLRRQAQPRTKDFIARFLKDQIIYRPDGKKYKVDYVWKCLPPEPDTTWYDLNEGMIHDQALVISHWQDQVNPLYPQQFQTRDLLSRTQEVKIQKIVQNFDPFQAVVKAPLPTMGPPVVWTASSGVNTGAYVLAGNSRALAISRLSDAQYKFYLQAIEKVFGDSAEARLWGSKVWCTGSRGVLVREIFHLDGTPLSFDEAVQFAAMSQKSPAGKQTILGEYLAKYRSIVTPGFVLPRADTLPLIKDKLFMNDLQFALEETPDEEDIRAVLVGWILPRKVIDEKWSQVEAERIVQILPLVWWLRTKVERGDLYPEYGLDNLFYGWDPSILKKLVSSDQFSISAISNYALEVSSSGNGPKNQPTFCSIQEQKGNKQRAEDLFRTLVL